MYDFACKDKNKYSFFQILLADLVDDLHKIA